MIKKLKQPIDQYFQFSGRESQQELVEKVVAIQAISFTRGGIFELEWVLGCKSLTKQDRQHIMSRIQDLQDGLAGKEFDHDPSKPRPTSDFDTGKPVAEN